MALPISQRTDVSGPLGIDVISEGRLDVLNAACLLEGRHGRLPAGRHGFPVTAGECGRGFSRPAIFFLRCMPQTTMRR